MNQDKIINIIMINFRLQTVNMDSYISFRKKNMDRIWRNTQRATMRQTRYAEKYNNLKTLFPLIN